MKTIPAVFCALLLFGTAAFADAPISSSQVCTIYSTPGTYLFTPPLSATWITGIAISGAASGASGIQDIAGTAASAGAAGSGGGIKNWLRDSGWMAISSFTYPMTVVVGSGGPATTTAGQQGNLGTYSQLFGIRVYPAGSSSPGSTSVNSASGGTGGLSSAPGNASGATAGYASGYGGLNGASGNSVNFTPETTYSSMPGGGNAIGTVTSTVQSAGLGPGGGGAGAGFLASQVQASGTSSASAGSAAAALGGSGPGGNGANGNMAPDQLWGSGGGGGANNPSGVGGNGGSGAIGAGGGGGGDGSTGPGFGGAGGNGVDEICTMN